MRNIFIGLLFLFLTVGVGGIDCTPAWVGYLLILLALTKAPDSPSRTGTMAVAAGSAILTAALWVVGLLGYGIAFPLGAIAQLWTSYRLVLWCEEQSALEESYHLRRLRLSWYALAGATVAALVLGMLAPPMGWVWSIVAFGAAVVYIYAFYRLWRIAPQELKG